MDWRTIVNFRVSDDWTLDLTVGPLVIAVAVALILVALLYRARWRNTLNLYSIVHANVSFGGLAQIQLRPNDDVVQIAHCAWVELSTRKAGMPFDPKRDVIVEIYDSWYELFREMRRLASSCPVGRVATDKNTQTIIELIIDVLNKGLRPHLTEYQARFRRWYQQAAAREENRTRSPQEIQRDFPEYDDLITDLAKTNEGLVRYRDALKKIARRDSSEP